MFVQSRKQRTVRCFKVLYENLISANVMSSRAVFRNHLLLSLLVD